MRRRLAEALARACYRYAYANEKRMADASSLSRSIVLITVKAYPKPPFAARPVDYG
jgi:hypothetical protein